MREWWMGLFLIVDTGRRVCHKTKKRGQLNVCTLFPPAAEVCARLARNFCQSLITVKSRAYDLVWLNVWYFTVAGLERGSEGISSPYNYTTWLRERGRERGCVPSLDVYTIHIQRRNTQRGKVPPPQPVRNFFRSKPRAIVKEWGAWPFLKVLILIGKFCACSL